MIDGFSIWQFGDLKPLVLSFTTLLCQPIRDIDLLIK